MRIKSIVFIACFCTAIAFPPIGVPALIIYFVAR